MEAIEQASAILNQFSIIIFALILILLIVILVYLIKLSKENKKLVRAYNNFMRGSDGRSMEAIMKKIVDDNRKVKQQCKNDIDAISEMKKGLKGTYKKIGIVKYDTFRGMSGKLSFSLALLDGDNSGFVLSSMHTQDGCYSYLKEIIHGESHATLSNEERDALDMALNYSLDNVELEKVELS